jgi:cytochrome c-type biogenesis protein CcmH/NrfF
MQLTDTSVIVDFYPESFIAEAHEDKGMKVVVKRFVKSVTFRSTDGNDYTSYSTCSASDMRNDVLQRVENGYKVTDFHTEKFDDYKTYNPMWGAC